MPSGLMTHFSVSYDTATKIISAITCGVLLIAAVAVHNVAVAVLALAILGVAFAFSPRGYMISDSAVIIERLIGDIRIPLEGVREARPTTRDDLRGCVRLWGNGGLFGYYGLFRTRAFGVCSWYVTNRSRMVVVKTETKTALFSPDDGEGFLSAVRQAAPVGTVFAPEPFAGIQSAGSRRSIGVIVAVAIALAAAGFGIWAVAYSPGPPAYTLTSQTLTIHDKFYPVTLQAADVDVAHIRVVDLADDPDWRPVTRTNGFANAHYHSGWFRAANGSTMRLYQAEGHRLVLLPPSAGGTSVLYQAKNPEEFVQEITAQWRNPN